MNKPNVNCYQIFPRVVLSDVKTELTVYPLGKDAAFEVGRSYRLTFVPREYGMPGEDRLLSEWVARDEKNYPTLDIVSKDGTLVFSFAFAGEQEWTVCITPDGEKSDTSVFPVYAVQKDLYDRTPYIGDCHVHSSRSDGNESPGVVAANYRRAGFDFMALTDHRRFWPSLEMIEQFADVPIDMKLFRGEEVHDRTAKLHIVNFGGRESINEHLKANEAELDAYFTEEGRRIAPTLPRGVNPTEYAARKYVYEQIKRVGGFAIFAHPTWQVCSFENNVALDMAEAVLTNGIYDALELVTGQTVFENNTQQYIYHEMRAKGLQIPIVGNSDSHGTDPASHFGHIQTMVFAPDCEFDSLCSSIRDLYSVAIEHEAGTQTQPHVHGPLRLVKYASFLMRFYVPHHNDLCFEEGMQMRAHLFGDPCAKEALARLHGRTAAYAKRFFGR